MEKKRGCVVIPTYNEAENIRMLLEEVEQVIGRGSKYEMDIIVADDLSADGTADIVKEMAGRHGNIQCVEGKREGMGAAYVRVLRKVREYYVIITMDADFSHPPVMILALLERIDKGCDVVIGSRYIRGGGTPGWSFRRKLISEGANVMARVVAGLYPVRDCTSNYRAIRGSVLRKIPLERVKNKGYAFVITTLWEYMQARAKVCEVPLVFYDRKRGETKLRLVDMIEFFFTCFGLRLRLLR